MYDNKITTIFKYITQLKQTISMNEKFYILIDMAKELIDADRCTIWRYIEEEKVLEAHYAHGIDKILKEPIYKGIVGECFNTGETIISNNVNACEQFDKKVDEQTGYHTKSIISIPIYNNQKKTIGVFQALNKNNDEEFTNEDVQLLDLVTAYITEVFESTLLYEQLEEKVKLEVEKNKQKDIILLEQAKNAALGDMIGNIAHQWRQPLNAISFSASSIVLENQLGVLEDSKIEDTMDFIIEKSKYLSKTIDVFRDFVKNEKIYSNINLMKEIEETLNIIKPVLDSNKIKLKYSLDFNKPLSINMVSGEFQQVVLNIINNAKDALKMGNIENKWIEIELDESETHILISIADNAGGIPEDIRSKIFEPYFTTKHQHQGTGLGLHICYRIITESLMGKLYEQNTDEGAKFFIEIPKH